MTSEPGSVLRAAFLIVLLVACGKDESSPATTFPTHVDEEDFSAGVSIQCAAVGTKLDVATSNDDLSPAGGTITDGRWELTQSFLPDDEPIGKKASVLVFAGREVAWSSDTDIHGNAVDECCRGTWSVDGTDLDLHVRCKDGNEDYVFDYTAEPTKLRIRTTGSEYTDTYEKR